MEFWIAFKIASGLTFGVGCGCLLVIVFTGLFTGIVKYYKDRK